MGKIKGITDCTTRAAVLLFAFFVALSLAPTTLHAEILLENRTGTVSITTPDGQVMTIEADQPLPAIPSGSTIEVVTGTAQISATGTDVVSLLINGATAAVQNGAKVSVAVDLRTGAASLDVLAGSITILQTDGTTQTVAEGSGFSQPALAPTSVDSLDVPGTNSADSTGRQGDATQGRVSGSAGYG